MTKINKINKIDKINKYYKLGVELLDPKTQRPLEHIAIEFTTDLAKAWGKYNDWKIGEHMAKYIFLVTKTGDGWEEMELASEGYLKLEQDLELGFA